jgi:predicted transcriptional regulator
MRSSNQRTIFQALAVYLFWLKTGLDQMTITAIFGLSQQDVSRYLQQIREGLMKDFVPNYLGN